MEIKQCKIAGSCAFVHAIYGHDIEDVALEYVEHASDHWHSDTEVSIEINRAKAEEIVAFLTAAFKLDR